MNARSLIFVAGVALLLGACDSDTGSDRMVGELASDRVELTAEVAEPIIEVLVAEGEQVSKGQVLLRQDARRATARLAEAEAAVLQNQARLDEFVRGPRSEQIAAGRANVAGSIKELEFRQGEFERFKELHARELASPDALDRARAALDAASANDELRRAQLQELLSGTTVEVLTQAEQALQQTIARHDLLAVDVERHETRAPVDGIVDSRLFEPGERPTPGQAMLILLPGEQPHARIYVPEESRVNTRIGDAATVFVDGLDESVTGRVRWVASEAMFTPYFALTERDRGHLTYEAKVDIQIDGARLPDGVPVEVEMHD
ncbi:MAG: HlyD family secretion protein [Woeseiaceae bacterium]